MRIHFRVDSSLKIGSGHVMRCLTLADEMRKHGVLSTFISRHLEGNLINLISTRGHQIAALNCPSQPSETISKQDQSKWLETTWQVDANETTEAIKGAPSDWLIVDHYGIDEKWEKALRPSCKKLLVIDDLANRPHDCDILLDQGLDRASEDYEKLLTPGAHTLVGTRYALLRSEFRKWRKDSLKRRRNAPLKQILVNLGGVDLHNHTSGVMDALEASLPPPDLKVLILMGRHSPWLEHIKIKAASMRFSSEVIVDTNDMARLMANSDLAIGAAGGTALERCSLGLPSLTLITAENQRRNAITLAAANATILIKNWTDLTQALQNLYQASGRFKMQEISTNGASIVDTMGANRVSNNLLGNHV